MRRRDLLKHSGALVVTFSASSLLTELGGGIPDAVAQGINGVPSRQLDSWIAIAADGHVTAYTGKCEIGQGLYTAQTQLIAEELSVPIGRVTLVQCDTARTPDQGTTSGAQSHPANFNQSNLALACATARAALLERAAARLKIATSELTARDGVISVSGDTSRRVSYGVLIGSWPVAFMNMRVAQPLIPLPVK